MNAAMVAGYTSAQTISWLCLVCVFGGLLSLLLALRYQQPIIGAWSIPIAVILGNTLTFFNINQAVLTLCKVSSIRPLEIVVKRKGKLVGVGFMGGGMGGGKADPVVSGEFEVGLHAKEGVVGIVRESA